MSEEIKTPEAPAEKIGEFNQPATDVQDLEAAAPSVNTELSVNTDETKVDAQIIFNKFQADLRGLIMDFLKEFSVGPTLAVDDARIRDAILALAWNVAYWCTVLGPNVTEDPAFEAAMESVAALGCAAGQERMLQAQSVRAQTLLGKLKPSVKPA